MALFIVGAAIASTARVLVDCFLLFGACSWLRLISPRALRERKVLETSLGVLVLGAAIWASSAAGFVLPIRIGLAVGCVACYVVAQWRWSCDLRDRQFLRRTFWEILKRLNGRRIARGVVSPTVEAP